MHDDDLSVRRRSQIHFEHVDAHLAAMFERVQRVLRPEAPTSLVRDDPRRRTIEQRVIRHPVDGVNRREVEVEHTDGREDAEQPTKKTHHRILTQRVESRRRQSIG